MGVLTWYEYCARTNLLLGETNEVWLEEGSQFDKSITAVRLIETS
jgi:hypothetical protein